MLTDYNQLFQRFLDLAAVEGGDEIDEDENENENENENEARDEVVADGTDIHAAWGSDTARTSSKSWFIDDAPNADTSAPILTSRADVEREAYELEMISHRLRHKYRDERLRAELAVQGENELHPGNDDETIEAGSWVRFTRGRYKGDLGRIISSVGEELVVETVPRIPPPNRKYHSQERPPQGLFDPAAIRYAHGDDSVIQINPNTFRFSQDVYVSGLARVSVQRTAVLRISEYPMTLELRLFEYVYSTVEFQQLTKQCAASRVPIRRGDRVSCVGSDDAGVVEDLHNGIATVTGLGWTRRVPLNILRRAFRKGDHVEALDLGTGTIHSGLVVSVLGEHLEIAVTTENVRHVEIASRVLQIIDTC